MLLWTEKIQIIIKFGNWIVEVIGTLQNQNILNEKDSSTTELV
jgi:hypothetical protein